MFKIVVKYQLQAQRKVRIMERKFRKSLYISLKEVLRMLLMIVALLVKTTKDKLKINKIGRTKIKVKETLFSNLSLNIRNCKI